MIRVPLILLWLYIFTIGRQVEASALDVDGFFYWPIFIATSTATNVGVLCLIAGAIGNPFAAIDNDPIKNALLRSFILYVGLLAGTLIAFNESIVAPDPKSYITIAANMSSICLAANVPPEVYQALFQWFKKT